jgi:hypothetical protein
MYRESRETAEFTADHPANAGNDPDIPPITMFQ